MVPRNVILTDGPANGHTRARANGTPLLPYQSNPLRFLSSPYTKSRTCAPTVQDVGVVGTGTARGGRCQTHYFIYNGFSVSAGNDKTTRRDLFLSLFGFTKTHLIFQQYAGPIKRSILYGKLSKEGGGVDV